MPCGAFRLYTDPGLSSSGSASRMSARDMDVSADGAKLLVVIRRRLNAAAVRTGRARLP